MSQPTKYPYLFLYKGICTLHILLFTYTVSANTTPSVDPPNIIVILSDDGGYGDFGCYGGKDVHTPHIDDLAKHGVRFTNSYVTASVCSPSRAGLLTGQYQQRFGFDHNPSTLPTAGFSQEDVGLDTNQKTIANYLQTSGYTTIAIGKWHLGDLAPYHPRKRGFDHFYGFLGGSRSYYPIAPEKTTDLSTLYDDDHIISEDSIRYLTDDLTDKAITYINRYRKSPFFMYLAFNAVHTPMDVKPETLQKYAHVGDPLRRQFLALIDDMDSSIGRIVAKLKEENLYENTLIIFLNDNGGAVNNGSDNGFLRGLKGSKWEGGIKVPLLMQWPRKLPQDTVCDALVSSLDILPTAVSAASDLLSPNVVTDGINLFDVLNKETAHSFLFWRRGIAKAVRHQDWKLIKVADNPLLLFDLSEDPGESRNIAATHPNIAHMLLQKLDQWEQQLQNPRWDSSYGNENQILKHRMEVIGREMEKQYP